MLAKSPPQKILLSLKTGKLTSKIAKSILFSRLKLCSITHYALSQSVADKKLKL